MQIHYGVMILMVLMFLSFGLLDVFADNNKPQLEKKIASDVRNDALNNIVNHLEEINCQDPYSWGCKQTRTLDAGLQLVGIVAGVSIAVGLMYRATDFLTSFLN